MKYRIDEIVMLTGARRYGSAATKVKWLLTDSRSLVFPDTTLFFAIRTSSGDGHEYIDELYCRGVRSFMVSALPEDYAAKYPEAVFLVVPSPLKALQRLAERHRERFNIPVIGITGSNGKTMVKEWINQLISPMIVTTRSPRSYNSQIGVPLSVMNLSEQTQIGIFEAGISQPGEMESLREVMQPTIGVLTNLGNAHQENFGSMEEKCLEKLRLFKDCDVLVYCCDDAIVQKCVTIAKPSRHLLAWSMRNPEAPFFVKSVSRLADCTDIAYCYRGVQAFYRIPFIDSASVTASIHCLAICLYLGLDINAVHKGMQSLEPIAMRLELTQGASGCTVINDTYNADVNSLDIALDFLNRRSADNPESRVVILSDILQGDNDLDRLYQTVADMINSRRPQLFIGVGKELSRHARLFNVESRFFSTTGELLASGALDFSNKTILLKGSRRFAFEKVYDLLTQKVHETTLNVNLGALVDNLNHYRSFLKPGTKITCMVKASGYGCGSLEVARTLQEHGVDYLAVAVADEGVYLRNAGITANIMVMNPEMTAFRTMLQYRLEPEIYSFRILDAMIREAKRQGVNGYPVHIKIDSGMHRLGFSPDEMPQLIKRLKEQNAVVPRSVFSHFVGSDGGEFDDFTRSQFAVYYKASLALQQACSEKIIRHICNTAGIERFPEYHLDMVRLGLGLYGIDPFGNRMLRNVASLRTTLLQIHRVAAGETVGYSRRTTLTRDSRIAAIPIGYADGLDRRLGNGNGYCLVAGQPAPFVGNICMDVAMVDVTGIPCREGDSVEIFGDSLPITELSDKLATIPYEVLTSVSERVKRVYFKS